MSTSSSVTPFTPDQLTPRRVAMTRSFTVPPKLNISTRTTPIPEIGAAEGIETLYVHPSASIIKFNTGGSRPSSSSGSPRVRPVDNSGTLSWAYPTESTVAVGPMEIYRVPGSVSFLHSGALLHAILPRSQCWCVDGVSKFAFRVLPDTYYRIELPGETAEDLELVEALKLTLKKVLFYERTPCPFARGFTVDLPAEEVKVKKRNSVREGPAKKWKMEKTYSWKPEGWEEEEMKRQMEGKSSRAGEDKRTEPSDEEDSRSNRSEEEEEGRLDAIRASPSKLRPTALGANMRSVTAPSQVRTQQTIPSRVRSRVQAVENVDRAEKAEKVRFSAEVQRRTSVRVTRRSTIPVDMPPSPPDSSTGAELQVEDSANDLSEDLEDNLNEVDEEAAFSESEPVGNTQPVESEPVSDTDARSDTDPVEIGNMPSESAVSNKPAISHEDEAQSPPLEPQTDAEQDEDFEAEYERHDQETAYQQHAEPSFTEPQHTEITQNEKGQTTKATSSSTLPAPTREPTEDPYAAIQARIQLRRSIGGSTTTFHPTSNPPISKPSSSNASSISISSQLPNKTKPKPTTLTQRNHSITAALVNKACAVFLGPPAHLVTMMLRIAARFSSGAFGSNSIFFVESPVGSPRRIPGSFYLEDEEEEEEEDWDEDDFGVPLKSPVRVSALRERARRHGWEME
jgi:hypothetical protein